MIKITNSYKIFNQEVIINSKVHPCFIIEGYTIDYKETDPLNKTEKSVDFIRVVFHYNSMNEECTHPVSAMISFGKSYVREEKGETKGNYDFMDNNFKQLCQDIITSINKFIFSSNTNLITEENMNRCIYHIFRKMTRLNDSRSIYGIEFDEDCNEPRTLKLCNLDGWFTNIIHTHLFKGISIENDKIERIDNKPKEEVNVTKEYNDKKDDNIIKIAKEMTREKKKRINKTKFIIDRNKFEDYKKEMLGL